jgi:hypothetical protein
MSFGWTTSPETTVHALYELRSLDRVLYLGSRQAMSPFQGFRCGGFSDRRGFDWTTRLKAYITGCTQTADGASSLTDDESGRSYTLIGESSELKTGERVKLRGKKKKDKQGKLSFRVSKIKKDYGPCQQ